MNTYYIVRHGQEYPEVTGAVGRFASESDAERTAWAILGTGDEDFYMICYTQVVKVTGDGLHEEVMNEFEF